MGLFQYNRMPFGLSGFLTSSHRLIYSLVDPNMEFHVYEFLDKVVISNVSFEDPLKRIRKVVNKLQAALS